MPARVLVPPFMAPPPLQTISLADALALRRRAYTSAAMLERAAEMIMSDFGGDPTRGEPRLLIDLGEHGIARVPAEEVQEMCARLGGMAEEQRNRARRILLTAAVEIEARDAVEPPMPTGPTLGNVEQHGPFKNPRLARERTSPQILDDSK